MCGADFGGFVMVEPVVGSSPRVRSRPGRWTWNIIRWRIISACAEQTAQPSNPAWQREDHLRVCGADLRGRRWRSSHGGSSPRVRSRLVRMFPPAEHRRIISACAEQTALSMARLMVAWDHLRVCGADSARCPARHAITGSSPRVRSRHPDLGQSYAHVGIISACAEQTHWDDTRRR